MSIPAGTRLGPYEIASPLGAGGMGEVYRARDTRLQREVAIKVLPPSLVPSEERRQRFEREAKLISQLSHPHICTLYDMGSEGTVAYLVMELLDGETLADKLARGPLSIEQTVQLGAEICSALDAAHSKGIVHRDLKPGNVMLTKAGVKLLDFGLAKALTAEGSSALTQLPTEAEHRTASGIILGTLQYMSPEQLEGRPADARADVFALGTVLFEMATGKKAFTGRSHASLISAILTSEPPMVSSVQPVSPPALDHLVRTCMAKDPEERWRSAHDVGLQLKLIASGERPSSRASAITRQASRRSWLPWLVAVVASAAAVAASVRGHWKNERGTSVIRFTVPPPSPGRFNYWAESSFLSLSPDGSQIAFVASDSSGVRRIWVRPVSALEARPLAGTEGGTAPFFSPDNRSLAFFSGNLLKRVDLAGGPAVPVCEVPVNGGKSGTWGAKGDILFSAMATDGIFKVSSAGGAAVQVIRANHEVGEARALFPKFLPDGERFVYSLLLRGKDGKLMLSEPGTPAREIVAVRSVAEYADPGVLFFVRDGTLIGQRFDLKHGRLTGSPVSIADGVRYFQSTGAAAFAVSLSGTLAYSPHEDVKRLVWFDFAGKEAGTLGPPGGYLSLAVAPSGRRILVDRAQPGIGTYDIFSIDMDRETETRLTSRPESEFGALWLSGEKSIVYSSSRSGTPQLFRQDLATEKDEELLPTTDRFQVAQDVSPDGTTLIYTERTENGTNDIWTVSLTRAPEPRVLMKSAFDKRSAKLSPDGRVLAFLSNETGRYEVYVTPFPGPGERTRVSSEGVRMARWANRGNELLYLTDEGSLMSTPVQSTPSLDIGRTAIVFKLPGKQWLDFGVSADGKRILAIEPQTIGDELPFTVVVNWTSEFPM